MMEMICSLFSTLWNRIVSLAGSIIVTCVLAGGVAFLAEKFIYAKKKRKTKETT